jgi:hypothetical protein
MTGKNQTGLRVPPVFLIMVKGRNLLLSQHLSETTYFNSNKTGTKDKILERNSRQEGIHKLLIAKTLV